MCFVAPTKNHMGHFMLYDTLIPFVTGQQDHVLGGHKEPRRIALIFPIVALKGKVTGSPPGYLGERYGW